MAQDTTLGHGAPGIASFATQSYGGPGEPRFGDGVARTITVNVGPNVDLPIYSVVSYDGETIALAEYTAAAGDDPASSNVYGITTAPVVTGAGQSTTIDVYVSGHWDMDQMNWDDSFDSDEKRKHAFEGSAHPSILMSKKKYNNDQIVV